MAKFAIKLLVLVEMIALFPLGFVAQAGQAPLPAPVILNWEPVTSNGFGNAHNDTIRSLLEFNNRLFAGTRNPTDGAELWRTLDAETWTRIRNQGLGDTNNTSFASLFKILDYDLYLGTENEATGGELWRSTNNGDSWDQFNSDGLGDPHNTAILSGGGLYGGGNTHHVFAGTKNWNSWAQFYHQDGTSWTSKSLGAGTDSASAMCNTWYVYVGGWNWATGAQLWQYTWPSKTFTALRSDGFGTVHNAGVRSLLCVGYDVYIGTYNSTDGAELWRYNETANTWTPLASGGFDDVHNVGITSLSTYGDYIYAGTENNITGTEVWRSLDGNAWEQVNSDGFGNPNNTEATSMAGFGPYLFVGTRNYANGAGLWRVNLPGLNTSFLINADEYAWFPDVAYNSTDHEYLVVWTYKRSGELDDPVFAQRLSWSGQLLGSKIPISEDPINERGCAHAAYDSINNRYLVSWHYYTSTEEGVRAQLLSANGEIYGGVTFIASGLQTDNTFGCAEVAYSPQAGRFLAVFQKVDVGTKQTRLQGQAITATGAADGTPFPISPLTNGDIASYDLAYNPSRDEFLAVWDEYLSSIFEVYGYRAHVYAGGGARVGSLVTISDNTNGKWDWMPAVSALPTVPGGGQYLVGWLSGNGLPQDVIGRSVSGNAGTLGSFQTFSLKAKDFPGTNVDVAGIANGRFQIVWNSFDTGYNGSFIMGRSYGLAGDIGPGPLWQGGTMSWGPAIAAGLGNSYLVVYLDNPPGTGNDVSEIWGRLGGISTAYLPAVRK